MPAVTVELVPSPGKNTPDVILFRPCVYDSTSHQITLMVGVILWLTVVSSRLVG